MNISLVELLLVLRPLLVVILAVLGTEVFFHNNAVGTEALIQMTLLAVGILSVVVIINLDVTNVDSQIADNGVNNSSCV